MRQKNIFVSLALVTLLGSASCSHKPPAPESDSQGSDAAASSDVRSSDRGNAYGLETVHFEYDSSMLDKIAKRVLKTDAGVLRKNPALRVQIEGHCDQRGGIQYNLALGEKRADSVRHYLEDLGVGQNQLTTISYGKERPLDTAQTEEACQEPPGLLHGNQRADLTPLRRRTAAHAFLWTAAGLAGVTAVLFARLIARMQSVYFAAFQAHPFWTALAAPFLFAAATLLVQRIAPDAKGSGIPQVLGALEKSSSEPDAIWKSSLVSPLTAVIKVLSSTVGILGGASIGREGPTVQVATSLFAGIGRIARRWLPEMDFRLFATAGAAAGVAAAFNTPLAGITFAIEEISEGMMGRFTEAAVLAVVLSGIAALALAGDYLYFGHPSIPAPVPALVVETLVLAAIGGVMGGVFARLLAYPKLARLPSDGWRRAFVCGLVCSAIGWVSAGQTSGSGYEITRHYLDNAKDLSDWHLLFSVEKMVTTVLSYLSGMAGGIFSPCLSIGAGIGFTFAKLSGSPDFKACALIGMVAFFSAVVQAPLTSIIIVMEMTGEHVLVLNYMVAAFVARAIGRLLLPVPLYRFLASREIEA